MERLNGNRMRLVVVGIVAVIVLGGQNAKADFIWRQKADMPTPRWKFSTCSVYGKIYAIGGRTGEQPYNDNDALSTVEEYDPVTDTWVKKSDMPTARSSFSASVVNSKIYVIGGSGGGASTVEEYNPATDTWTRKADMPTARRFLSTCAVDGKIYAIGGIPIGSYMDLPIVEVYDPATNTWTRKANMPLGPWGLSTSVVNGKIYTMGGGFTAQKTVWEYDPTTETRTRKANMIVPRRNFGTSVLYGKIYAFGGWQHSNSNPYSSVEVYDPVLDVWTQIQDMPVPRAALSTCVVDDNIYAFGGTDRGHPCPATSTVYELGPPRPDFNGDGIVDAEDMCIMIDHWGENYSPCDIGPTPLGDGIVDVQDLIILAEHMCGYRHPIAHWTLDEKEGNTAYDKVFENNASVYGGALWQPIGGMVGGALEFDGIDDYASTDFVLNPAINRFSVFAWIKGGASGQVILSQIGVANWLLADASDGNLMTELKGTGRGATELLSQAVITDGNWHRIGLVWDGSQRTLYVDDFAVAEDTQGGLEGSDNGLYIGAGKDLEPESFWFGLIDEVRVYDVALSAEEIAALAH